MVHPDPTCAAEAFARAKHKGQVDKGGHPYVHHLERVSFRATMLCTDSELPALAKEWVAQETPERAAYVCRQIGWLHDVVEDTEATLDDLKKAGFEASVLEGVMAMTKQEGESRKNYLRRVKKTPQAIICKLADIEDNMDLSRLEQVTGRDERRTEVYRCNLAYLRSERS